MPFSTLLLSGATVGMTTLAFAIATPASAQQNYAHKHYAHTHYAPHYRHYATTTRVVISSSMRKNRWSCRARATPGGPWRRSAPVVGGTGQAVAGVFTGAGAIVGGFVGGVLAAQRRSSAARPAYAYGAPFAAPFNAAGTVAGAPFQVVGGAFGAPPPAHASY